MTKERQALDQVQRKFLTEKLKVDLSNTSSKFSLTTRDEKVVQKYQDFDRRAAKVLEALRPYRGAQWADDALQLLTDKINAGLQAMVNAADDLAKDRKSKDKGWRLDKLETAVEAQYVALDQVKASTKALAQVAATYRAAELRYTAALNARIVPRPLVEFCKAELDLAAGHLGRLEGEQARAPIQKAEVKLTQLESLFDKLIPLVNAYSEVRAGLRDDVNKACGFRMSGALQTHISKADQQIDVSDDAVYQEGVTAEIIVQHTQTLKTLRKNFLKAAEELQQQSRDKRDESIDGYKSFQQQRALLANLKADVAGMDNNTNLYGEILQLSQDTSPDEHGLVAEGFDAVARKIGNELVLFNHQRIQLLEKNREDARQALGKLGKKTQEQFRALEGKLDQHKATLSKPDVEAYTHRLFGILKLANEKDMGEALTNLEKEIDEAVDADAKLALDIETRWKELEPKYVTAGNLLKAVVLLLDGTVQDTIDGLQKELVFAEERFGQHRDAKRFVEANAQLDKLARFVATAEKDGTSWQSSLQEWKLDRGTLEQISAEVRELGKWPPITEEANDLRERIATVVRVTPLNLAFDKARQAIQIESANRDALKDKARQGGLDPDTVPKNLGQLVATARWSVSEKGNAFNTVLNQMAGKLLANDPAMEVAPWKQQQRMQVDEIVKAFDRAMSNLVCGKGESPAQAIERARTEATQRIQEQIAGLETTFNAPAKLGNELKTAQQQSNIAKVRALRLEVAQQLEELAAMGGSYAGDHITAEVGSPKVNPTNAALEVEALTTHKAQIIKAQQLARLKLEEKQKLVRKSASELTGKVKKISFFSRADAQGFIDNLNTRAADIKLLSESDDPVVLEEARVRALELERVIASASEKHDKPGSLAFIIKLWGDVSQALGKGDLVKDYTAATYTLLYAKLSRTIAEAQNSTDLKASQTQLEQLQLEVSAAVERAGQVKAASGRTLKQLELLGGRLAAVVDHADMKLLNKPAEFVAQEEAWRERLKADLRARLAQGVDTVTVEQNLQAVLKEIDERRQGYEDLLAKSPKDCRADVRKANSKAEQDERLLRDMADVWNASMKHWDQLLIEVETAIKKRGKDNPATEAQLREFKSLKVRVGTCGTAIEPHLKLVSLNPFSRLTADSFPDLAKAKSQFADAHKSLSQLDAPARRLRDGEDSTLVVLNQNFTQLGEEWLRRVAGLQRELKAIQGELAEIRSQSAAQLAPNELTKLDQAVAALDQAIERALQTRFTRTLFRADFGPFEGDAQKDETPAAKNERLAAREAIKRSVRKLKAELRADSVLVAMSRLSADGVFKARTLRATLGYLQACLRKIDLAATVSV